MIIPPALRRLKRQSFAWLAERCWHAANWAERQSRRTWRPRAFAFPTDGELLFDELLRRDARKLVHEIMHGPDVWIDGARCIHIGNTFEMPRDEQTVLPPEANP